MLRDMADLYRIHEFAELAGVTVKALHHYDRLGLLEPRRTGTGYRVYTSADLERLEQIVALKFIGLSLREIKALLDRGSPSLGDALRLQRRVLEERRRQIDRAIQAIEVAELQVDGDPSERSAGLRRLIEAIAAETRLELLKAYFGEEAWERWKARRATAAPREWAELYRDIDAAIGDDIRSPRAQALADRWLALLEREAGGDPSVRTGLIKAWAAGHRLPQLLPHTAGDAAITRATKFMADVLWARWDDELRARPRGAVAHKASDSQIAIFRRAEALVDRDPMDPDVQSVAASWNELLERETGRDPETMRMMRLSLARRASWPEGMRRYVASLYATTPEVWEKVVNLLERAREAP